MVISRHFSYKLIENTALEFYKILLKFAGRNNKFKGTQCRALNVPNHVELSIDSTYDVSKTIFGNWLTY